MCLSIQSTMHLASVAILLGTSELGERFRVSNF